jgi:hypothetical protein
MWACLFWHRRAAAYVTRYSLFGPSTGVDVEKSLSEFLRAGVSEDRANTLAE